MNEKLLNEFAIYYKRIIRVERTLKDLIIQKYTYTYGEKQISQKKLTPSHTCLHLENELLLECESFVINTHI